MMNPESPEAPTIPALLEMNAHLASILESISDGFFTLDHQLTVTYFNATAGRLLGRTAAEVVGRPLFDAFPEAKGSIFEEKYLQALREKTPLTFETYFDVPPLTNWYDVRVYPFGDGISVFFQVSTWRKQADAELRESRARFRELAENIQEVFWVFDTRTQRVIYLSPAFERLAGRPGAEIYRRSARLLSILHPEDREKAAEILRQLPGKFLVSGDFRLLRPDGELRWVQVRTFPMTGAAGEVERVAGVAEDITARKLAEAEIHSIAQFPDENPAPVLRVSQNGQVTYINRTCQEVLGAIGLYAGQPAPAVVLSAVQAALSSGQNQELELESGDRIFSFQVAPFLANGYVNLYGRDITAIRQAENEREQLLKQVEAERNLWKTTVESMLDPVTVSDAEGHAVYMNSAYERMISRSIAPDLPLEEHSRHYALYHLDGTIYEPHELPLQKASLENVEVSNAEIIQIGTDGRKHVAIWNAAPLHGPDGKVLGAVAIGHEVTDQREAEAALIAYATQLERLNRELQDFAFIASHDLQEPLRKISAFAGRLQTSYKAQLDAQGLDYLERLCKAADRMRDMIENLLDYSRVTTQGQPFAPVDLNQVMKDLVSEMDWALEREGAQVEAGELPTLLADRVQISRLLRNLLLNALKFRQVTIRPHITVTAERLPAGQICLRVADNGIGFDDKYLSKLFLPFSRLEGRDKYEGTGMGLAICRKIVERHGGTITAQGRPGQGATFVITLPGD